MEESAPSPKKEEQEEQEEEEEQEARSGSATNRLLELDQVFPGFLEYTCPCPTDLVQVGYVKLPCGPEKPKPPQISSVFSTVDLGCPLDLRRIAQTTWNVEYTLKTRSRLVMRIRRPRSTAVIYSTGKLACMGTKSTTQARAASRRFARVLQKAGVPVRFLNFRVENMAAYSSRFPVELRQLALSCQGCSYEPEMFLGVHYTVEPNIVATVFSSGKVNLTGKGLHGCKSEAQVGEVFERVWERLSSFRRSSEPTHKLWPAYVIKK
ncbi:uncharacterized protein V6R79_012299 [Siganus canaliculatus]